MSKLLTWGLSALMLSVSGSTLSMDYVPKCLKSGRLWGAVALAAVVSGTIYCIEYWQDGPNRDLFQGVCEGNANKVALALYDGAQHDRRANDGSTLLHYAVRGRHHALIPLLTHSSLPGWPLINIADKKGNTPLFYALENNDKKMCQLLCRAGANWLCTMTEDDELYKKIEAFNRDGRT